MQLGPAPSYPYAHLPTNFLSEFCQTQSLTCCMSGVSLANARVHALAELTFNLGLLTCTLAVMHQPHRALTSC